MFSSFRNSPLLSRPIGCTQLSRAGAFLVAATAAPAAPADVNHRLTAEAYLSASNDPLLTGGPDREALLMQASVRPGIDVTGDTGSSLRLDGNISPRRYSRLYGGFVTGGAEGVGTLRVDERLSITTHASYDRDVSVDVLTESLGAVVEPQSIRNLYGFGAGIEWRPDALRQIRSAIGFEKTSFEDSQLLMNTEILSADAAYDRRLSELTTVGIRAAGSINKSRSLPDFTRLSLAGTLTRQLSSTWQIEGDAGVERIKADRATIDGITFGGEQVQFSGQTAVCGTGERLSGCLRAGIASESSALGGLRRRTEFGADLTNRLGPRHTLSLSGGYQHSASRREPPSPGLEALRAEARLDWQLSETLRLSGNAEYLKRDSGGGRTPDALFVGIRLLWQLAR